MYQRMRSKGTSWDGPRRMQNVTMMCEVCMVVVVYILKGLYRTIQAGTEMSFYVESYQYVEVYDGM